MNYNNFNSDSFNGSSSYDVSVNTAFPLLMRKVYVWMALALVITGLTAYGVASSPGLVMAIASNRLLTYGLMFAELGLVIWLTAAINRISLPFATLLFITYSVLNGLVFSLIFLVYTMTSIANVFFITAGTFALMAFERLRILASES